MHRFEPTNQQTATFDETLLVRAKQLVRPSASNGLVAPKRLFSNWVVLRSNLIKKGSFVSLHRISTKTVLLERRRVTGVRARITKWPTVLLVMSLIAISIGALLVHPVRTVTPHRRVPTNSCEPLDLAGLGVGNPFAFDAGQWSIVGQAKAIKLGQLESIAFTAKCRNSLQFGNLIVKEAGDSWQIKKMVLID